MPWYISGPRAPRPPYSYRQYLRSFTANGSDDDGKRSCGRPFVLRLSNDGVFNSDPGFKRSEQVRREKAVALRFRVAVFVNGSKVRRVGI